MEKINNKYTCVERALWSIAFPGFGQLLNHKYVKGLVFISLEIVINIYSNINQVIILSFHGKIEEAIIQTNYLWFMFYPCLYFFSIWDAYKDAGGGKKPFAYLPLVVTTYVTTIGVIYSPVFRLFGYLFGPIWLLIFFTPLCLIIGQLIRSMITLIYMNNALK